MRISHEAIYQSFYIQGRGALRRDLTACLRSGRALRVPRERVRGRGQSFVTDAIMISERPPEVEDRAVPGHWEGDLIRAHNLKHSMSRRGNCHDNAVAESWALPFTAGQMRVVMIHCPRTAGAADASIGAFRIIGSHEAAICRR